MGGGGGRGSPTKTILCHFIFDSDWMLFDFVMRYICYKTIHVLSLRFMNNFSGGGGGAK